MENQSIKDRAAKWLDEGKKGVSSKTIYAFFMAKDYGEAPAPADSNGYPSDSDDLGRCLALLVYVSEWRDRLGELSEMGGHDGAAWAALAAIWGELESLYHAKNHDAVNQRMRETLKPMEAASGEFVKIGENATMRVRKDAGPIAQALKMKAQGASDEEVYTALQKGINANATDEELLQAARYIVARENKASVSFIQRHLQIGYNRASILMEKLEAEGSVSAADDTGKRTVSEKLAKAYGITQRIDEIAKATGTTPEKVFSTAQAKIGHNSGDPQEVGGVSGARLKAFLDRVERLEQEKAGIAEDIKEIYAEAKGTGYDIKTMRKLVRLRKMNTDKRREEEEILELYKAAVGLE